MDKKIAGAIGLLRHQIISPVIMDTGQSQMKYFKSIAAKEFDVPGQGAKRFKPNTMKGWLRRYKQNGFAGITPKIRADLGGHRKIPEEMKAKILKLREEFEDQNVARFYKNCLSQNKLGDPAICLATLRRLLTTNGVGKPKTIVARKRFEMGTFGELWTGDFMHGPLVKINKVQTKKAILFAVIDDHSRLIVGSGFDLRESTIQVEEVLKNALLTFGLPDRIYLDNGASFSSHYLARACANLGVGIVHSKPYDSPSRGKIERFFRTVREGFSNHIKDGELNLEEINEKFKVWLRDDYHKVYHQGILARPIDRYNISTMSFPRKRIDPNILNEHFMVSLKRKVKKDSTVSIDGKIYEVPAQYIRATIELRHIQGDSSEIYIYEEDKRIIRVTYVDAVANGKNYRPTKIDHISYTRSDE